MFQEAIRMSIILPMCMCERVRALNNVSIDIIYMSIAISPRIPSGPQGFSTILTFTFGKKIYQETCVFFEFYEI